LSSWDTNYHLLTETSRLAYYIAYGNCPTIEDVLI